MPNIYNSDSPYRLPSEPKQSENNIFSNLFGGLVRLTQYILNNPGKAMTLGLASQVLGSSALGQSQNQSSVGNNNLTQAFIDKPYLVDSLAAIEQRVAPTLNLTWLNQSSSNQMEPTPAWLSTNDTDLDERADRVKRNLSEGIDKYLREHVICLKSKGTGGLICEGETGSNKEGTTSSINSHIGCRWRLSKSDDNLTYYLYNIYYNQYMFDSNERWNSSLPYYKIKASSAVGGPEYKWVIVASYHFGDGIAVDQNNLPSFIKLINYRYNNRAIYTSDYDSDTVPKASDGRRHQIAILEQEGSKQDENKEDRTWWEIRDCNPHVRQRRAVSGRLEDAAYLAEREYSSFLDKTPSKFVFFQIKQPGQAHNMSLESAFNHDFDRNNENQTALTQLR